MAKKNSSYIPKKSFNPAVISKRIEENRLIIESMRLTHDMKYKSLEDFVILLANFASHDIKNAVHNLDGLVSTIQPGNLTNEDIENLKSCIDNIRHSLDEYAIISLQKSSDDDDNRFELIRLMSSLETLHRSAFKFKQIKFIVHYNNIEKNILVHHKFRAILQMLNNLIINSTNALENSLLKIIEIEISLEENNIIFLVKDTGEGVPEAIKEEIFKPYFSTRKGSGVGLAHVRYVLQELDGSITLLDKQGTYITCFKIKFPIEGSNQE